MALQKQTLKTRQVLYFAMKKKLYWREVADFL